MVTLEVKPNKYVGNVLFLLKFWLFFLTSVVWIMVLAFASKVPSPSSINAAIEFTKEEKKPWWYKLTGFIARCQAWLIALIALPLGQWAIFIFVILFIAGTHKIKPSAKAYLSKMHIDLDKKKAVIDV
jgi:glycerol-3-phosphate acyltransferase PlsY